MFSTRSSVYPCKNVFIYHLWQLLGSNHLQTVFTENLFQGGKHAPRTPRHESFYSHSPPGTKPRSSSDLRDVPAAAGCLGGCGNRRQDRCKLQYFVFEVRSHVSGEDLRFELVWISLSRNVLIPNILYGHSLCRQQCSRT